MSLEKLRTLQMTVNGFMDYLFSYSAGKEYSFKGRLKKKSCFKELFLYKVVKRKHIFLNYIWIILLRYFYNNVRKVN